MQNSLTKRLSLAASYAREGAILADIGTDHGYLPLHLLSCGKISRAVCADINRGPLDRARENAAAAGLSDKIDFVLTDGAVGLSGKGITDFAICGMGGELIAEILSASDFLRDESLNFILQPMTRAECLREYLWDNGFSIEEEGYATEGAKHYLCIRARFCGKATEYTEFQRYFGKEEISSATVTEEHLSYIKDRARALSAAVRGKLAGCEDATPEQELLRELAARLGDLLQ